jgi:hypothetical protein
VIVCLPINSSLNLVYNFKIENVATAGIFDVICDTFEDADLNFLLG